MTGTIEAVERHKVGDKVHWSSQASGSRIEKQGIVLLILPAGCRPFQHFATFSEWRKYSVQVDPRSFARDHESYLVYVPTRGKSGAMDKLYWPRVKALKKGW